MTKKKKENRGGKRKGAGRKSRFSERTETISFRCPISKIGELKTIVNSKLSQWAI